MKLTGLQFLLLFTFVYTISSCTGTKSTVSSRNVPKKPSLHFLGEYDIPYNFRFNNTTVGGLSGIDHDTLNDCYYLISDDRSAIEPARFYTARILVSSKGIDSVYFTASGNMLQPGGNTYPNNRQNPLHTPDPEAMRYYAPKHQLVWSSEGERIVRKKDTVLENPEVYIISMDGKYQDSLPLPATLQMQAIEKGPRQNGALEGMTFADHYKTLYINMEEPLYEDGPRADTIENNAFIRILQFDMATRRLTKQFAYKLDPIAYPPNPPGAFRINGVPDIMDWGEGQLLVIERSFSTGRLACTIKLFIANTEYATDISNIPSLKENNSFIAAGKQLLVNMDELGIFIDNIEGVTFGPVLPNGHKTLLFVSDNNFNPLERSQLLLFEVIE